MTRIVFIGAGSVEFTRNLLGDILTFPELADAEIVLHDINAERLATAEAMATWTNEAVGARARDREPSRPAARPRRRRLRDQHDRGRRHRRHAPRLRHPEEVRAAPDDRRHLRRRRRLPRPAHDPRDARHRRRHGRALPRRLDAQLHQPHGDELLGLVRGSPQVPHRRPLPLDPEHEPADRRVRRRAAGRDHLPRRRRQPHELGAARRARGQEPVPGAGRGDRGRPRRARPPRPRPDLQALRLLPHRVERALRRVRALVHARRRRDRAPAHPRGRVHPPQRGEPRASTSEEVRMLAAGEPFEIETQPGVRLAHHPLDGHRRGAHDLRQRAQQRA